MAAPSATGSGAPWSSDDGFSRPRAGSRAKSSSAADPVLRNALRYTITSREYEKLHKFVLSRSRVLRRKVPSPTAMEKYMDGTSSGRWSSSAAANALPQSRGTGKGKGAKSKANEPAAGDTYNARAVRHALRVFIITNVGMKAYEALMARIKGGQG